MNILSTVSSNGEEQRIEKKILSAYTSFNDKTLIDFKFAVFSLYGFESLCTSVRFRIKLTEVLVYSLYATGWLLQFINYNVLFYFL